MAADVDFFLKLDGIQGESQDSKHQGEMELMSFSFGVRHGSNAGTDTTAQLGTRVTFDTFKCTARASLATPPIFAACCAGTPIKTATITCRKAGGKQQEFLVYTLTSVLVNSWEPVHAGGDVTPVEVISLSFGGLQVGYRQQMPDGSLGGLMSRKFTLTDNTSSS